MGESLFQDAANPETGPGTFRTKIGLENARAIRGKLIGRKKMRDSDLIRKLIKSGLSYRQVSTIARCSHGSVSAEVASMKREAAELKRKQQEQAEAERQLQQASVVFPAMAESVSLQD